jgi:hypothetical protein
VDVKKDNIVRMTPLNPNVSLANEGFTQRAFFPKDETFINIVRSFEFKKLLLTDASSVAGQDFIAKYYGISNWA